MSERVATITIPLSRETVVCGVKSCSLEGKCTESCICIGCAEPIPIFPISTHIKEMRMTSDEEIKSNDKKIKSLRAILATEPVSISTKTPGGFDLRGQFTTATVTAVMANAEKAKADRPQPRTPTKVSGQFDPRQFGPVAVHALFPDAGREDFSDDRGNAGDDDTSEHSNLGMAADLINCEISGESGPGCGHSCDHVARATECLQNYARDEAMRKKNRDEAGKTHSVRFV